MLRRYGTPIVSKMFFFYFWGAIMNYDFINQDIDIRSFLL